MDEVTTMVPADLIALVVLSCTIGCALLWVGWLVVKGWQWLFKPRAALLAAPDRATERSVYKWQEDTE